MKEKLGEPLSLVQLTEPPDGLYDRTTLEETSLARLKHICQVLGLGESNIIIDIYIDVTFFDDVVESWVDAIISRWLQGPDYFKDLVEAINSLIEYVNSKLPEWKSFFSSGNSN